MLSGSILGSFDTSFNGMTLACHLFIYLPKKGYVITCKEDFITEYPRYAAIMHCGIIIIFILQNFDYYSQFLVFSCIFLLLYIHIFSIFFYFFIFIVSVDSHRVRLLMKAAVEGSDYINASFFDVSNIYLFLMHQSGGFLIFREKLEDQRIKGPEFDILW